MEALTPWHLAVILLGFLVLFGYRKLPEASRSLGRSLRIFRSELAAMHEDRADDPGAAGPTVPPSTVPPSTTQNAAPPAVG